MVTVEDVRELTRTLPRSSEHVIHDRVKFRVGRIVYVAFSRDETTMGFGYPKEERDALIASDPETFFLPRPSDLRFHWVECHLDRIDVAQMRELVLDAWRMVVPKRVAAEHLDGALGQLRVAGSATPSRQGSTRPKRTSSP
jgi:hypothetical protein